MLSTCLVYFFTSAVSVTRSDATSSSCMPFSFPYLSSSSVTESDQNPSGAWWQFKQRKQHTGTRVAACDDSEYTGASVQVVLPYSV